MKLLTKLARPVGLALVLGLVAFATIGDRQQPIAEAHTVAGEYSLEVNIVPTTSVGTATFVVTASIAHPFTPADCGVPSPGCYQSARWQIGYRSSLVTLGADGVPGNAADSISRVDTAPAACSAVNLFGQTVHLACLDPVGPSLSYAGDVWSVEFFCKANGIATFELESLSPDYSFVKIGSARQPRHLHSDSIECSGFPPPPLPPSAELEFSRDVYTVQCNGDSFEAKVTVKNADGSPIQGALVHLTGPITGYTNRKGVFRARITPEVNPNRVSRRDFTWNVDVNGDSTRTELTMYSCPFKTGQYTLNVHVFFDKDGDGIQDRGERSASRLNSWLGRGSTTRIGVLPSRLFRLGPGGNTTWSLQSSNFYHQGHLVGWHLVGWHLCVGASPRDEPTMAITSVNGVLRSSGDCVVFEPFAPGDNNYTLGITKPAR